MRSATIVLCYVDAIRYCMELTIGGSPGDFRVTVTFRCCGKHR